MPAADRRQNIILPFGAGARKAAARANAVRQVRL
jgi:hypothetical protein